METQPPAVINMWKIKDLLEKRKLALKIHSWDHADLTVQETEAPNFFACETTAKLKL